MPRFKQYFDEFISVSGKELKSECYLPRASDWLVKNNYSKMRAVRTDSEWFGVTYKEDKEAAIKRLSELTAQGVYPEQLWK